MSNFIVFIVIVNCIFQSFNDIFKVNLNKSDQGCFPLLHNITFDFFS